MSFVSSWRCLALALLIAVLAVPAAADDAKGEQYLIVFDEPTLDSKEAARRVEAAGGKMLRDLSVIGVAVVTSSDPEFATRSRLDSPLGTVVADRKKRVDRSGGTAQSRQTFLQTLATDAPPTGSRSRAPWRELRNVPQTAPTVIDPTTTQFFPVQWNLRRIQSPEAWALGKFGHPSVRVAVLGSGVDYTHPELAGKLNLGLSRSFVPEDDVRVQNLFPGAHPIADLNFHSTLVAGIIGCNLWQMACIAPDVTLIGVKVQDFQEDTRVGDLVTGIVYSALIGSDVINMAFGFTLNWEVPEDRPRIRAVRRAIRFARILGAELYAETSAPFFMPGINADEDGADVILPAQAGATTLGATGPDDEWSTVSNFGFTLVHLSGPGGVLPAGGIPNINTVNLGPCSQFTQLPGLSEVCNFDSPPIFVTVLGAIGATAHGSGIAALVDSDYYGWLHGFWLRKKVIRSSDDVLTPGRDAFSGFGRVNAFRAVTE